MSTDFAFPVGSTEQIYEESTSRGGETGLTALEAKWLAVPDAPVEHEDRMSKVEAARRWAQIYVLFAASDEGKQLQVEKAVYAYFAVNGTSRLVAGEHRIKTGSGVAVRAAEILSIIGRGLYRKFCRADVDNAFMAVKLNKELNADPVFLEKAREKGLPSNRAYLLADFFRGCSKFSPEEEDLYEKTFAVSVVRANHARGGKDMETIISDNSHRRATAGTAISSNGDDTLGY